MTDRPAQSAPRCRECGHLVRFHAVAGYCLADECECQMVDDPAPSAPPERPGEAVWTEKEIAMAKERADSYRDIFPGPTADVAVPTLPPRWERFIHFAATYRADIVRAELTRVLAEHDAERAGPTRGCGAPMPPWVCGETMPSGVVALCDACAWPTLPAGQAPPGFRVVGRMGTLAGGGAILEPLSAEQPAVKSRSVQRREALMRGEEMPRFDAEQPAPPEPETPVRLGDRLMAEIGDRECWHGVSVDGECSNCAMECGDEQPARPCACIVCGQRGCSNSGCGYCCDGSCAQCRGKSAPDGGTLAERIRANVPVARAAWSFKVRPEEIERLADEVAELEARLAAAERDVAHWKEARRTAMEDAEHFRGERDAAQARCETWRHNFEDADKARQTAQREWDEAAENIERMKTRAKELIDERDAMETDRDNWRQQRVDVGLRFDLYRADMDPKYAAAVESRDGWKARAELSERNRDEAVANERARCAEWVCFFHSDGDAYKAIRDGKLPNSPDHR